MNHSRKASLRTTQITPRLRETCGRVSVVASDHISCTGVQVRPAGPSRRIPALRQYPGPGPRLHRRGRAGPHRPGHVYTSLYNFNLLSFPALSHQREAGSPGGPAMMPARNFTHKI
jgi:hypothetical protein